MKTDELNLTIEELEELCHLYLECRLSVLEEKELEYVLTRTAADSPVIAEVRSLMSLQLLPPPANAAGRPGLLKFKFISGIAAAIAVILSLALFFTAPFDPAHSGGSPEVYIAAYSHGERLDGSSAVKSTDMAMAKADSLMQLAAVAEREYMLKADDIINETLNNL